RHPVHLLSVGLGTGLSPLAPGTVGTLVGVALYMPMAKLPVASYLGAVLLWFVFGVAFCGATARFLGVHDHPSIVSGEIVGFLVTMTAAPQGTVWILAGFCLFRFFDIAKPWPIRRIDRELTGGLGIMLDDVLAGIFAAALLQLGAVLWGPVVRAPLY
ncbi:MAG: phosphatidylglycerophosphatase A, partial [Gammaproteobacteria bacterium]